MTVLEARKKWWYRLLESSLGLTSYTIIILVFVLSFYPNFVPFVSVLLILYGLFWIFKISIITIYTIYTYKQLRRWEKLDWPWLINLLNTDKHKAVDYLQNFADKYKNKLDFKDIVDNQIELIKSDKFIQPKKIYHVALFTVYNEGSEVLARSLKCLFDSHIDNENLIIGISQEERNGKQNNLTFRTAIDNLDWVQVHELPTYPLDKVYSKHSKENLQNSTNQNIQKTFLNLDKTKLNIFFTEHPKDLIGEIKGKASNEDWAARNLSLYLNEHGIDDEHVLVTSLDADSHVGGYFFANLTYKYITTKKRKYAGFQPVHVYSNNFFKTGFWPRQIATQTTLDNMGRIAMTGETSFFAIYSLSMNLLRRADFWERQLIAEDSILTARCIVASKGHFHVYPHFGVLEGDAVEDDDYVDALVSQYKQLQRWSWGGVEGIPYLFKIFFVENNYNNLSLRTKLKWLFLYFSNHIFWSTTPILFSVGMVLPQIVGGYAFRSTQIAQNLSQFAQFFAWISMMFLAVFSVIVFRFITVKAQKHTKITWYNWYLIMFQVFISPFIYMFLAVPAFDSQTRGILGKYLSYIVTPKK